MAYEVCLSRRILKLVAIPPTIPTSFVPKQPVHTTARHVRGTFGILSLIAFFLAGAALIVSGGVFAYERYLIGARDGRAAELADAEQKISRDTVEGFIRLHDRLVSAEALVDRHVTLSAFFSLLETLTLQNVRFNSLALTVGDDRTAELKLTGIARNFNALAAESAALSGERAVKRAVFSGIKVGNDGFVGFSLSALLEPDVVTGAISPANPASETP